ncbi:MAG: hypothetical protein C0424_01095 [Sphingobacteriaceae bacterium]|nr:hypothetical protein [Sphingobacteriaceae bacterium]
MKKLVFALFWVGTLMTIGCSNNGNEEVSEQAIMNPLSAENEGKSANGKLPEMTFDKDLHDFGTIAEGEKVTYSFRFKNTGNSDLIIQTASGSCGCTVPEYPQKPIKAGETGFIKVQFNSEGRAGIQEKQVTIVANTIPNTLTLKIKAEVSER